MMKESEFSCRISLRWVRKNTNGTLLTRVFNIYPLIMMLVRALSGLNVSMKKLSKTMLYKLHSSPKRTKIKLSLIGIATSLMVL